jgi:hypothetical protein
MKRPTVDVLADIDAAITESRAAAFARTAALAQATLETASRTYGSGGCDAACLAQHHAAEPKIPNCVAVPARDQWRYTPERISPNLFPPDPDQGSS